MLISIIIEKCQSRYLSDFKFQLNRREQYTSQILSFVPLENYIIIIISGTKLVWWNLHRHGCCYDIDPITQRCYRCSMLNYHNVCGMHFLANFHKIYNIANIRHYSCCMNRCILFSNVKIENINLNHD